MIIIELTYLLEEKFTFWKLEKTSKYADLVACCKFSGWNTYFFAVEVRARGFASVTLRKCFAKLGLFGKKLRESLDEIQPLKNKI